MHVKTSKKKESTQVGKPNKPEIDQFTFTFFTFYLKKYINMPFLLLFAVNKFGQILDKIIIIFFLVFSILPNYYDQS